MDALVNSLMEELNCETVFTIPIFGGIPIYESVVVTWIIMAVVIVLCILLTRNLSVEHPGRRQIILETAVNGLNNFFRDTIGENGKRYIPYWEEVPLPHCQSLRHRQEMYPHIFRPTSFPLQTDRFS